MTAMAKRIVLFTVKTLAPGISFTDQTGSLCGWLVGSQRHSGEPNCCDVYDVYVTGKICADS